MEALDPASPCHPSHPCLDPLTEALVLSLSLMRCDVREVHHHHLVLSQCSSLGTSCVAPCLPAVQMFRVGVVIGMP